MLLVHEVHDELLVHENFVRQKSGILNRSLIGNDGVVATTYRKTVEILASELEYISRQLKKITGRVDISDI